MSKKNAARIIALSLLVIMLLPLSSCSSVKTNPDLSVEIISTLVYKDSDGDYYTVEYDADSYVHDICGIHEFTDTVPKSFEGYVIKCEAKKVEDNDDSDDDDFTILTAEDAAATYGTQLKIYKKTGASVQLLESYVEDRIENAVGVRSFEAESCTATDIANWSDEFDKNGKLEKSFKYYDNTTVYEVTFKAVKEKFKLEEKVMTKYEISGDYEVIRQPMYNEEGKKVATFIYIKAASVTSFSFVEY